MATTAPTLANASSIVPEAVLSAEEIEVLRLKFARCSPSSHPTRALSTVQAVRLFRDDYPSLSEMEVHDMFRQCDLNHDGHLALAEYLQTRAYYRLVQEERTEHELLRCFSILDTDNDGLLRVSEVQQLLAQSGQPVVAVLAQAIVQAARETKRSSSAPRHSRMRRLHQQRQAQGEKGAGTNTYRDGEITFESFALTIRDVNRKMEQEIAAKTLRAARLQDQLVAHGVPVTGSSSPIMRRHPGLLPKAQPPSPTRFEPSSAGRTVMGLQIELEVLTKEIQRIKRDLISGMHDSTLGQICEALVASFDNEQHVYECLSNLIDYCGLRDAAMLRHKLEQSGREVNVLDTVLMAPPEALQKTAEFKAMMDLSPPTESSPSTMITSSNPHQKSTPRQQKSAMGPSTPRGEQPREPPTSTGILLTNATLRKQFAFYAMASNPMNFTSITRSGFMRFAKDCALHELRIPALTDAELYRNFTLASGASKHMTFRQWLRACELLLHHAQPRQEPLSEVEMEHWMQRHVIASAKIIPTQSLAPDISQTHVMKLLSEKMWTLKQIFCHFAKQSLTEVTSRGEEAVAAAVVASADSNPLLRVPGAQADHRVTLQLKEFLELARVFGLVRASVDGDGEPFTSPPSSPSKGTIEPISFVQLMREYYAARLDIGLSDWRETTNLTFREFLRCIERVAVAMHAHNPKKISAGSHANGVVSTSFEAIKDDGNRAAKRVQSPLYNRRGNLLGASVSPTKNCKMTSTSVISILLKSSREMVRTQPTASSFLDSPPPEGRRVSPQLGSVSYHPIKVVYGQADASIKTPTPRTQSCTPRSPPTRPERALISPRARPVTSGGPPVIHVIHPPTVKDP